MYKDFQGTHGVNLSADVCGVKLPNPFILASGPETDSAEKVLRAFDCGWGGAILKTVAMDLNAHTNVTPRFNTVKVNGKPVGFTNMEVSRPMIWTGGQRWCTESRENSRTGPSSHPLCEHPTAMRTIG